MDVARSSRVHPVTLRQRFSRTYSLFGLIHPFQKLCQIAYARDQPIQPTCVRQLMPWLSHSRRRLIPDNGGLGPRPG